MKRLDSADVFQRTENVCFRAMACGVCLHAALKLFLSLISRTGGFIQCFFPYAVHAERINSLLVRLGDAVPIIGA
jgi:hypothetical protein